MDEDSEIVTRSQEVAADVAALTRARNPLIWVVTREEARVEGYLMQAAGSAGYIPRTWDVAGGTRDMQGTRIATIGGTDPGAMLEAIRERATTGTGDRGAWIMRDLAPWLTPPIGMTTQRQLRNLARLLPTVARERAQVIIMLTPSAEIPPELSGHATVIEWPLPDRNEIAEILDEQLNVLPDELKARAIPEGARDAAIDAAVGLAGEEAAACYAKSLVQFKCIDPIAISQEKKRVIARERVLEWYDPLPGGLNAVGGLDQLKAWLMSRASAFTVKAREYGLPTPKGCLIVGVSGCGKSLVCKAIATAWGVPLLKLDLNALKSKFVGGSEGNLRRAIAVIEALGRCVVWLDEIEKALQGATSGSADGGVSADALGTILTWMQERKGEAFVIATANDIRALPPELLRKGRFDEVWWVDLPNPEEREAVLSATLRTHGRGKVKIDLALVAGESQDFTGAEIATLVPEALFTAFNEKAREITTNDLVLAASTIVPLAKTAEAKIKELREWAAGNARPATSAQVSSGKAKPRLRRLDI